MEEKKEWPAASVLRHRLYRRWDCWEASELVISIFLCPSTLWYLYFSDEYISGVARGHEVNHTVTVRMSVLLIGISHVHLKARDATGMV